MSRLEAAGSTDTGRVRDHNEDAYLIGDSVFAVADGMGGHQAGEVASATALAPIETLDGRVFPDGTAAVQALVRAVDDANAAVSDKSAGDSRYRGMGTTLTAVLFEGRRLHLAHVGDSRAYLLREGEFSQLTHDHTLVQHLVDEGQISIDEAASHPQRSIITRAIGVSPQVEIDSLTLELVDGDVLLLCSDGLTGPVEEEEIADILVGADSLDGAVQAMIGRANEAGGPDNITAVLLRWSAADDEPASAAPEGGAGAAAAGDGDRDGGGDGTSPRVVVRTGAPTASEDWAQRLGRLGTFGGEEPEQHPRRRQRLVTWLVAGALVLALLLGGGRWLLSRSYYVGLDEQTVAIYQGIPVEFGPLELSWVVERTGLRVDDLPEYYIEALRDGIAAIDRRDARLIVENSPRLGDAADADTEPGSDPTTGP